MKVTAQNHHLVFLDTEFAAFEYLNILSIGAICAGSHHTFYRELNNPAQPHLCSDFVRANVLPLFDGGSVSVSSEKALQDFFDWLTFLKKEDPKPIAIISDAPSWEAAVLQNWLDRHEAEVPEHLWNGRVYSFRTNDQGAEIKDFESFLGRPYREHHALDDAKLNCFAFEQCDGFIP